MSQSICDRVKECPDCVSTNIVCDPDRDQVICRDCGLIFEPLAERDAAVPIAVAKSKKEKVKPSGRTKKRK